MHRRVKLFCNGIKFVKRQGVPEKRPAFCCVGNKGLADQKQTQTAKTMLRIVDKKRAYVWHTFLFLTAPFSVMWGLSLIFFYKIEDYARPGFVITNSQVWLCWVAGFVLLLVITIISAAAKRREQ